ncbi:calcium proton exchanger [Rhizopogon vinicolor AM-OR11-026]|uniref:Calcium proton exchanger n=1 Tax=Rhizopogon vinicolor AM-OR11-026 TaxID=1314800 RepID=A0A1B7N2C6_9AGAM|nr:calcium proton exchanger [Rhizopogon vinicolor AM-OR11-026]
MGRSCKLTDRSLLAHSTASTFHTPNTVEEAIPLTSRPPELPAQPSRSITDRKTQERSFNWKTCRKALTLMSQPETPIGKAPNAWRSIQVTIFASWLNVLLWAINFALPDNHTLIFVLTFLAIIPLAKLLAFATDELSMRVGQTLAGLLNATLGNAVELIVSIIALAKCQLTIVQSSLVGSVLSNLLLGLGMCFFAGGLRFSEQGFGQSTVQLNSSLLTISVITVLLPGAFHMVLQGRPEYDELSTDDAILKTSHGVAIILLFIYAFYLVLQLFLHKVLCGDNNEDMQQTKDCGGENSFRLHRRHNRKNNIMGEQFMLPPSSTHDVGAATTSSSTHPEGAIPDVELGSHSAEKSEAEEPLMSVVACLWLLVIVTMLVAVTAEFLIDSIDGLTASGAISKDLGVAVGSSIQIALFVIPFIVTLGWIMGKPLTLLFDPLESIVMFLAVITVNYAVQDDRSNLLGGMTLMCLYMILAVTFWYYPGTPGIFQC